MKNKILLVFSSLFVWASLPLTTRAVPAMPLINLSVECSVSPGSTTAVGFVVGTTTTVLIRAIGPGLQPFKVSNTLADPTLSLYNAGGQLIATNDNWGDTNKSAILQTSAAVGAFALTTGSTDSALMNTLAPGAYSAVVSAKSGTAGSGTVLLEIYYVQ